MSSTISLRRMGALLHKESLQILRDPSALAIAFVLPPILLFLFAYAVSLDVEDVPFGLVNESGSQRAVQLAAAYRASPWLEVIVSGSRQEMEAPIRSGQIRGFAVIPDNFEQRLADPLAGPAVQLIVDGSSPNSANFSAGYARGVFMTWLEGEPGFGQRAAPRLQLQDRLWYNPELDSSRVLVPGAIALVMTMIGTLLTALVMAREWERGTMEAIMSTPASMAEILLSKLLPYFALGGMALLGCVLLTEVVFDIPLRGSLWTLALVSAVFLFPALGQGLLISTLTRNQFQAAMFAVLTAYLPAMLLSGFVFEIASMPWVLRQFTQVLPARHFVDSLKTLFLVGDVWPLLRVDMAAMLAIGTVFFAITLAKSRKSLA